MGPSQSRSITSNVTATQECLWLDVRQRFILLVSCLGCGDLRQLGEATLPLHHGEQPHRSSGLGQVAKACQLIGYCQGQFLSLIRNFKRMSEDEI